MSGPFLFDRVLESSTTTGTGTLTLAGAVSGYQSFGVVGDGNSCPYVIYAVDSNGNANGAWEVGFGTYTLSGTTLSRDTVLASSNGGSLVSFSSGTKRVALCVPAESVLTNISNPSPVLVFEDTFVDTNGTALTSHTPTPYGGFSWTVSGGTWQIQSNELQASTDVTYAIFDGGISDFTVETTNVIVDTGGNQSVASLIFRYTNSTNHFEYTLNSASQQAVLYEINSGTPTALFTLSTTLSNGTPYTLKVTAVGSSIWVFLNGTMLVQLTGITFNQTATHVGLRAGVVSSGTNIFTSFLLYQPEQYTIYYVRSNTGPYTSVGALGDQTNPGGLAIYAAAYLNIASPSNEHVLSNAGSGTNDTENVLRIWNSGGGVSGIRFIAPGSNPEAERGAIGTFFGGAFNGTFVEASNTDGSDPPTPFSVILTGVVNGTYGSYARFVCAADGSIHWASLSAGSAAPADWFHADANGNIIVGSGALATNATNGFLYLPSSAGAPTGTPTSVAGAVPIEIDTTNGKIWAYYGGAWHYVLMV